MVPVTMTDPGGREDVADVGAALGGAVQIRHLAGVAAREPLVKERQLGMIGRPARCRTRSKPSVARLLLDVERRHACMALKPRSAN